MSLSENFELNYTAAGGRPYVKTTLHISPDGQAELFLGSSWSLPQAGLDTVGFFSGEIPPNAWRALQDQIAADNIMQRSGGAPPTSPDMASRYLTLRQGGRQTAVTITDTSQDPALARLEEALITLMTDLTAHPLRAARLTMELSGGSREPQFTIANVGVEPLSLLLFDSADVNRYLRADFNIEQRLTLPSGIEMWPPVSNINTPRAEIMALVEANLIPEGVHALAPGAAHTFSLPAVTAPQSNQPLYINGTVTFWLSEPEADHIPLTIQTTRTLLYEPPTP